MVTAAAVAAALTPMLQLASAVAGLVSWHTRRAERKRAVESDAAAAKHQVHPGGACNQGWVFICRFGVWGVCNWGGYSCTAVFRWQCCSV